MTDIGHFLHIMRMKPYFSIQYNLAYWHLPHSLPYLKEFTSNTQKSPQSTIRPGGSTKFYHGFARSRVALYGWRGPLEKFVVKRDRKKLLF